jgi:hypothetical protein
MFWIHNEEKQDFGEYQYSRVAVANKEARFPEDPLELETFCKKSDIHST